MKILFPNKSEQSNVKEGFVTSPVGVNLEEAPPDYALPENDCPALTALQFEQIASYLKFFNMRETCDEIFEKVLEARLNSKNLVTRHILLDFIEKITPLTSPRRLISQIIDFTASVRFNDQVDSRQSKQLKMEDVASLVSHFKPDEMLTDSALYRQIMLAITPEDYQSAGQTLVPSLKEIEAQMFFSILTKFDLSNITNYSQEDFHIFLPVTVDITHKAIQTCRNSIKKFIKSEKKKKNLVDDFMIAPPTWLCALVEQLTQHYMVLIQLQPGELIPRTLVNLLSDAQPPLSSTITNKSNVDYSVVGKDQFLCDLVE